MRLYLSNCQVLQKKKKEEEKNQRRVEFGRNWTINCRLIKHCTFQSNCTLKGCNYKEEDRPCFYFSADWWHVRAAFSKATPLPSLSRSCIVLLQCIKWRGLLGQTVNNSSRATAIPILSFIVAGSRYHYCGSAVLVLGIEVTAPVMGVDEASQPAVQSEVGDVVRGEHQQVVGFFPPAYLVLFARHKKTRSHLLSTVTKQRGDFFFLLCFFELYTQMQIELPLAQSRMQK